MSGIRTRLRTLRDRERSFALFDELRRSGRIAKSVIIAEMQDGSVQVLGMSMTARQIAPLLVIAADALTQADEHRKILRLESHEEPAERGEHNQAAPREREITTDADGILAPPPGENFASCGECGHPRWYVLGRNGSEAIARLACGHCGNEVKMLRVDHAEGHA
jgi:hypothetical protein